MAMVSAMLLTPFVVQAQRAEPAGPAASAPATTSAKTATLEPADFTTKAAGQIELAVGRDSPIYAEFQGSPALTQRLREALQAQGFELAPEAGSSKARLQFRGDIVLMGGPKFHKGVKAPVGDGPIISALHEPMLGPANCILVGQHLVGGNPAPLR
jgi:hypothetical protein